MDGLLYGHVWVDGVDGGTFLVDLDKLTYFVGA